MKEKLVSNNYQIQFNNNIPLKFDNKDCPSEKLKVSYFRNVIKVPYIGVRLIEYKKKLERLFTKHDEDLKVIYTTKVGKYFTNKEETPHELKSNVVYYILFIERQ